jgi:hypothetical protein
VERAIRESSNIVELKALNEAMLGRCDREELATAEKLRQEIEALRQTQFVSALGHSQAEMKRSWAMFELRQAEEELLKIQSGRSSIAALF